MFLSLNFRTTSESYQTTVLFFNFSLVCILNYRFIRFSLKKSHSKKPDVQIFKYFNICNKFQDPRYLKYLIRPNFMVIFFYTFEKCIKGNFCPYHYQQICCPCFIFDGRTIANLVEMIENLIISISLQT